tara:strand:+ start:1197 stop:1508 length:312 start_codon:yes stop_codon:yes gene_type:complete
MTDPNPFNNTSDSLKGVIDAARNVIAGEPTLPDEYGSHIDAAADEISKGGNTMMQDDITKIMQKHFNAGSEGNPQATNLQRSFEKEVSKRMQQNQAKAKWEEH